MKSEENFYSSLQSYQRRHTHEVQIGDIPLGGINPIRIQTMTSTKTTDTKLSVEQIIRCVKAGSEYIRLAVPKPSDVENLHEIKKVLLSQGYTIPVVADVHFNAKLALQSADIVDKVRINPGNFADRKRFTTISFSEEEYTNELQRIEKTLIPLIEKCKKNKVALRIGTNHGSLSDRIMSRFGDTPEGMSESSMEFLRILKKHDFNNVVISMKSSNTRVMVYATRLLISQMNKEDMDYPVHLGVTEAGEGEDGRIKSAVGIGTLLMDGIGDTIRVSLTEEPEEEIPVAKKIVSYVLSQANGKASFPVPAYPCNPFEFNKRKTKNIDIFGGTNVPVIIFSEIIKTQTGLQPDIPVGDSNYNWYKNANEYFKKENPEKSSFLFVKTNDITLKLIEKINLSGNTILILQSKSNNRFADIRSAISYLNENNCQAPVIASLNYDENNLEDLQLKASIDLGGLLIDGLLDGIYLENRGNIPPDEIVNTSFSILQAARVRTSKTEYISCPSCGRTLFDIQQATRKIREKTSHLKNVKIGIMGCIVNGLGEMADADYGYVGAGPGKINLYKNKLLIKKNLPEDAAVSELIALIKDNGDWVNS